MKYGWPPKTLLPPQSEEERLMGRIEAEDQLEWIDGKLKEFRKLRRLWNTRLGLCLKRRDSNGHAKEKVSA